MDDTIEVFLIELWKTAIQPFLIWWILSCSILVMLAEITHRLLPDRQVALKAYLWKITTVILVLLPALYILFPFQTQISIQSIRQLFAMNEVEYPPAVKENLYEQWNTNVQKNLGLNPKPVGIFENETELPTLPTISRNLPGYNPNKISANYSNKASQSPWINKTLGSLYFLGFFIAIATALVKQIRTRSFLSGTHSCNSSEVNQSVQMIARELGLRQTIRVLICHEKTSPAVTGSFYPTLVIPSFMVEEWKNEERESILYHELNHFRSRDYLFVQTIGLLKTALWFFPGIYWLHKRSDETRETLSDAQAIQKSSTPRAYARLMLQLAESIVSIPSPSHLYFYTKHGERVMRRFSRILTLEIDSMTTCSWKKRLLILLVLLVVFFYLGSLRFSPSASYADIAPPGIATFDRQNNEYRLEGAEMYFAYVKVRGSFTISAKITATSRDGRDVNGFAFFAVCSDFSSEGITYAAGNRVDQRIGSWQGKITLDQRIPEGFVRGGYIPGEIQDGWLMITRKENVLSTYYFNILINKWLLHDQMHLEMNDPVYVGIGVWSEDLSRSIIGRFSDVKFTNTPF